MAETPRDPNLDAMADAMAKLPQEVLQQILGQLKAPAPTAPTPPVFQGLSPLKAAAAAMNPQFAPTLINQQMAPEQARFQQQQAAFEAAMQGRREAIASGTSLVNTAGRADAARDVASLRGPAMAKGQIRVVEGPDGKPALQEFVPDGSGGFTPGKILATGPDTLRFLATPEGYIPASSKTGQTQGYVQKPGGGNALPPPPAGAAVAVAGQEAAQGMLGTIKGTWQQFSKEARGPAAVQGAIQWGLESFPGATRTVVPEQDYITQSGYKAAMDNAILKYVNSLSGKQYTVKELEKFRGLFPNIYDPEQVVDQKIASLQAAVQRDIEALQKQYPATKKAASLDDEFDAYMRGANAPK